MNLPPLYFSNDYIRILPFESAHIDALIKIGSDASIWQFWPNSVDGSRESLLRYFEFLLTQQVQDLWRPHTLFTPSGECVGQSCYLNLRLQQFGLEIGGTWYAPKFQGSKYKPFRETCTFTACV